jgi:uncharacterized membrane protein
MNAVLMLMPGISYSQLTGSTHVLVSVAYLLVQIGLGWWTWLATDQRIRQRYAETAVLVTFLVTEVMLVRILIDTTLVGYSLFCVVTVAGLAVMRFTGHDRPTRFYRIAEYVITAVIVLRFVARWLHGGATPLDMQILLSIATAGLMAIFISRLFVAAKTQAEARRLRLPQVKQPIEYATAAAVTALMLGVVDMFVEYDPSDYSWTLVVMACSLFLLVAGIWARIKELRLWGLVAIMICVLKLVTFDIRNVDDTMRIVALIAGGLICFAVSALYNYVVKQFDKRLGDEPFPEAPVDREPAFVN